MRTPRRRGGAAWRSGPERRVSRPTMKAAAGRIRAVARPRARTSSGVSSALATPLTPSVPNRACTMAVELPLRVLGCLAGLLQAVLLAFLLPGISGEEAGLLQGGTKLRIEGAEGPGD